MDFLKVKSAQSILFILIVIFFALGYSDALALTLSPVRLEIKGDPGQELTEEMTLTNDTESVQTFYASFANFEAQGETGNPAFVESKDDLDTWMSTEDRVVLQPSSSLIVPIKIKIPNNAEPGGHFAAVFWGTSPGEAQGSVLSIGAKVGMLVLLSVSGDIKEEGGLLEFNTVGNKFWYNTLPVSFIYRFQNDGSDRIKPMGRAKIRNTFFIRVDSIDPNISQGNVLPGSIRRFEFDWIKDARPKGFVAPSGAISRFFDTALYQFRNFAIGPYSAKLDLVYGVQEIGVTRVVYFFVFPWQMIICLIVIIFIVFSGGSRLLKRYNKYIIQKARLGMSTPNDANYG
jgi:hypothetical protein